MKKIMVFGIVMLLMLGSSVCMAQKDKDNEPTSWLYFVVVRDESGKPVRNAAVIMHSVNPSGKQSRGGLELKTDAEGHANFDGIPYGSLRVQVLASGFQTYGEDFDVQKPRMDITIKLKRPSGQYSVYDDHPKDSSAAPKQDPPTDQKKPN